MRINKTSTKKQLLHTHREKTAMFNREHVAVVNLRLVCVNQTVLYRVLQTRWDGRGKLAPYRRAAMQCVRNERGKFPWKCERMLVNDSWFNLQSRKSADRTCLAPWWLITPHQHVCEQKCEIMRSQRSLIKNGKRNVIRVLNFLKFTYSNLIKKYVTLYIHVNCYRKIICEIDIFFYDDRILCVAFILNEKTHPFFQ